LQASTHLGSAICGVFLAMAGLFGVIVLRGDGAPPAATQGDHIEIREVDATKELKQLIDQARHQLDATNREAEKLRAEVQAAERAQTTIELEIEQLKRDTI
jgi:hypothetical protein